MKRIVVRSEKKKYENFENEVKKAARSALDFLRKDGVSVEVNLVSDREMRRLNRDFRGKDRATNVLSFPESGKFPHPESRLRFLGEVFLAPDYVSGKGEDLRALAVHGVLHLLGFSHERVGDRMKMEGIERKINEKNV